MFFLKMSDRLSSIPGKTLGNSYDNDIYTCLLDMMKEDYNDIYTCLLEMMKEYYNDIFTCLLDMMKEDFWTALTR